MCIAVPVPVPVPVAVGLALGDPVSGLLATLGAFTALYGNDRHYLNRALQLGVIALAFAVFVAVGDWAAAVPVLGR